MSVNHFTPACTVLAGAAATLRGLHLALPLASVPERWRRSRGWRASAFSAATADLCLFVLSTASQQQIQAFGGSSTL